MQKRANMHQDLRFFKYFSTHIAVCVRYQEYFFDTSKNNGKNEIPVKGLYYTLKQKCTVMKIITTQTPKSDF